MHKEEFLEYIWSIGRKESLITQLEEGEEYTVIKVGYDTMN